MKNQKIRIYANEKNVYLWEIAMKLNLNDGNFSRRLRTELSESEQSKIMFIIDQIAREKESAI